MTFYGAKELAESFRTVRRNTLRIAEDVPEEQYGFRPAPGARSVAETLAHLAVAADSAHRTHAVDKLKTFIGVDFGAVMKTWQEQEAQLKTKAQIVEALKTSGEAWASYLDGVSEATLAEEITFPDYVNPPKRSRFEMILSIKEHEMHHRGQLMTIERLVGIVPHLTRDREARMAEMAKTAQA